MYIVLIWRPFFCTICTQGNYYKATFNPWRYIQVYDSNCVYILWCLVLTKCYFPILNRWIHTPFFICGFYFLQCTLPLTLSKYFVLWNQELGLFSWQNIHHQVLKPIPSVMRWLEGGRSRTCHVTSLYKNLSNYVLENTCRTNEDNTFCSIQLAL